METVGKMALIVNKGSNTKYSVLQSFLYAFDQIHKGGFASVVSGSD